MTPIDLKECSREELEKKFLQMPKTEEVLTTDEYVEMIKKNAEKKEVETHKWLHNINTFQAHKNELCLRGTDEEGKDITIWFDSYDFLNWIDKDKIDYIKENLIKYINKK